MPVEAAAIAPGEAGEIVVALDGGTDERGAEELERRLGQRFPRHRATILTARRSAGEIALTPPRGAGPASTPASERSARATAEGAVPGPVSALGALLREGVQRRAAAVALVAAAPHDASTDWLGLLLEPVLEGGFEYVCPTYLRRRADAPLNTGIIYPLMRALYGQRLRQPLGGEAALALPLAARLLDDPDWRKDPAHAGSDAWLVAKVLAGRHRVCQAWLGARPRARDGDGGASETLTRALGLVFREMERYASRWQREEGSQPVPTFGSGGWLAGDAPRVNVERLLDTFRLAARDLAPVWALVLPPATLLGLRHAGAGRSNAFRISDGAWARIIYDFAVAHFVKTIERRQLLASLTPLYLGWIASFVQETQGLDETSFEARVEALCSAFEAEKSYLISRWRWPDGFNP